MSEIILQCLIGIQCKDFVMIAADQTLTQNVILLKTDGHKIFDISDAMIMGVNGNLGDTSQFAQYMTKNLQLYKMRNGYCLGTTAVTHFARNNMQEALRSGTPNMLNILIGGWDKENGCRLYTIDFLASCNAISYAAHGIGGYLSWGILDQHYKPNLTEKEAYDVLVKCVREIHQRLFMNLANFEVKCVTANGIKQLYTINAKSIV
ncbi:proteasome subunit beta type-2-like [Battus philenor]|uniref:proteasome subunit beta type-2-like n=1 Tax=Battus philenor TaxID=42288 RepID=UPI0035D1154D